MITSTRAHAVAREAPVVTIAPMGSTAPHMATRAMVRVAAHVVVEVVRMIGRLVVVEVVRVVISHHEVVRVISRLAVVDHETASYHVRLHVTTSLSLMTRAGHVTAHPTTNPRKKVNDKLYMYNLTRNHST